MKHFKCRKPEVYSLGNKRGLFGQCSGTNKKLIQFAKKRGENLKLRFEKQHFDSKIMYNIEAWVITRVDE